MSMSVLGSGRLWIQGRAGMTGGWDESLSFSWYPQVCYQKPLQVSRTLNYSLIGFFRPSWIWRNEFRLLGKMTVLNFNDEHDFKTQGDLQPPSVPDDSPHCLFISNQLGPFQRGSTKAVSEGMKAQRTVSWSAEMQQEFGIITQGTIQFFFP